MEHIEKNGSSFRSLGHELQGLSMTQYDSLMQRLTQLQGALDRQIEKENEKAIFIAETKFRLTAIERQLEKALNEAKEQALESLNFREKTRVQLEEINEKTETFPQEVKLQWQGATKLASFIAIVIGAIWSLVNGLSWIYDHLFTKGH